MKDIKAKPWHAWQTHSLSEPNLNLIKKAQTNCETVLYQDSDHSQSSCQATVWLILRQYITNDLSCYQLNKIRLFIEQNPVK